MPLARPLILKAGRCKIFDSDGDAPGPLRVWSEGERIPADAAKETFVRDSDPNGTELPKVEVGRLTELDREDVVPAKAEDVFEVDGDPSIREV